MRAIRANDLQTRTKEVLDLAASGETFIVSRPKNRNAVLLSEDAYNQMIAAVTAEAYRAQIAQELEAGVKSLTDPDTKWYTTEEAAEMAGL